MKAPTSPEFHVRWEARLAELTRADLTTLAEFAEYRLASQGLDPSAGEDVSQRALLTILRGLESDRGGRVPRPVDIETKEAFFAFVRGAISSVVEAMGRKRQFRVEHEPWEDEMAVSEEPIATPASNAEITDLSKQFFPRLRARAPRRLMRTIDAWESVFNQSDRIPARGHRRYVREVRELAQEVLSELGGIR